VKAVLLPRNRHQEQQLRTGHPRWFANGKTIVPAHTVDGLNMLWFSDLVVSGGGTMNREAAALGVPVYSIFRGRVGAVDRKLEQEGRLVMIREVAEVNTRIAFAARDKSKPPERGARHALEDIVGHIEHIIHIEHAARRR
jgi:predicted glycosyltransferase